MKYNSVSWIWNKDSRSSGKTLLSMRCEICHRFLKLFLKRWKGILKTSTNRKNFMHISVQFISPLSYTLISGINERRSLRYTTCSEVRKRFSDKEFHFHRRRLLETNRQLNCLYNKNKFIAFAYTFLFTALWLFLRPKTNSKFIHITVYSIFFVSGL